MFFHRKGVGKNQKAEGVSVTRQLLTDGANGGGDGNAFYPTKTPTAMVMPWKPASRATM
jgi:hypothetical protein